MYGALWRVLPGPTAVKVLEVLVLAALVVGLLFGWVFPWAETHLSFRDVTVDEG